MDRSQHALTPHLVSSLYTEAMLLADEARAHFDRDRVSMPLPSELSVAYSCESLKVTTRLMHSIAWLLNQKAILNGEFSGSEDEADACELGYATASDHYLVDRFPVEARELIEASEDLYMRLQRISNSMRRIPADMPAPRAMVEQLRQAF